MDFSRMNTWIRKIAVLLFLMYFAYLLYRLFFFAYGPYFRFTETEFRYNLIPFKTMVGYIIGINKYSLDVWFFNLFGNILAFMPMGFFLPLIIDKLRSLRRITIVTFLISSILEITQFVLKLGITDIDDVILNTFGGLMGYVLLNLIRKVLIRAIKEEDQGV